MWSIAVTCAHSGVSEHFVVCDLVLDEKAPVKLACDFHDCIYAFVRAPKVLKGKYVIFPTALFCLVQIHQIDIINRGTFKLFPATLSTHQANLPGVPTPKL